MKEGGLFDSRGNEYAAANASQCIKCIFEFPATIIWCADCAYHPAQSDHSGTERTA